MELDDYFVSPISGTLTSGFNDPRGDRLHYGVDIGAPARTPFVAPTRLRVTHTREQMSNSPGGMVWAVDPDTGLEHRFHHVRPHVKPEDIIEPGQQIGELSDISGPHLDWKVRDPQTGEYLNWSDAHQLQKGHAFTQGERKYSLRQLGTSLVKNVIQPEQIEMDSYAIDSAYLQRREDSWRTDLEEERRRYVTPEGTMSATAGQVQQPTMNTQMMSDDQWKQADPAGYQEWRNAAIQAGLDPDKKIDPSLRMAERSLMDAYIAAPDDRAKSIIRNQLESLYTQGTAIPEWQRSQAPQNVTGEPGLKEPWATPENVVAAFGGGLVASGVKAAMGGLLGNLLGEFAGGMAGEYLEEDNKPGWAWVAALAVDVATGMATDAVLGLAKSRIKRLLPNAPDAQIERAVQNALDNPDVQRAISELQKASPEDLAAKQQELEELIRASFGGDVAITHRPQVGEAVMASVETPGGSHIVVTRGGAIELEAGALAKHGKAELGPDEYVAGSSRTIDQDGFMWLASGEGKPVAYHEVYHLAEQITHSPEEIARAEKMFGGEEARAESFSLWREKEDARADSYFGGIREYFKQLRDQYFPNWETTFRKTASGEVWQRDLTGGQGGSTIRASAVPSGKETLSGRTRPDQDLTADILPKVQQSQNSSQYAIKVRSAETREKSDVVSFEVTHGAGAGKIGTFESPHRNHANFGTQIDDGSAAEWLRIYDAVPPAQRNKVFTFAIQTQGKLENTALVGLSSGCGRNAWQWAAIRDGVLPPETAEFMISCHGSGCYKNVDTGALSGGIPFPDMIARANREIKAGTPGQGVDDLKAFVRGMGIDYDPVADYARKEQQRLMFREVKPAWERLSLEQKTALWNQLKPEYQRGWYPQEVAHPRVITPEQAQKKINNLRQEAIERINATSSPSIRFNQEGDWLHEVNVGLWPMVGELLSKRGVDKTFSVVTSGIYVDIPFDRLREVAKSLGPEGSKRLTVQVSGPIDFAPGEAMMRVRGYDKLRQAGLAPVLRLITDEFLQGGKFMSDPESILATLDYIIQTGLRPRFVLETPFHLDYAWAKRKVPTPAGMDYLAAKLQTLLRFSPEEAEASARAVIAYNLTRYLKPRLEGGGERYLGLTYNSLRDRGLITPGQEKALKDLGYFYRMTRPDGSEVEGVFPMRCCTTAKCETCGPKCGASVKKMVERIEAEGGIPPALTEILETLDPDTVAAFTQPSRTAYAIKKKEVSEATRRPHQGNWASEYKKQLIKNGVKPQGMSDEDFQLLQDHVNAGGAPRYQRDAEGNMIFPEEFSWDHYSIRQADAGISVTPRELTPEQRNQDLIDTTMRAGQINEPFEGTLREGKYAAINVNVNRINTPEEVQNAIKQYGDLEAERFRAAQGYVSHAEMSAQATEELRDLASIAGTTPQRVFEAFGDVQEDLARLRARLHGMRQVFVSTAEQTQALAAKAAGVDATEEDVLAFIRAEKQLQGINEALVGSTAEAGRILNMYRIDAEATGAARQVAGAMDPYTREVRGAIDSAGGLEEARRRAEHIAALPTPEQAAQVLAKAGKATKWDLFFELWINGLLSGPRTHIRNILGNTGAALIQIPERFTAGLFSKLTGGDVQPGEAVSQVWGLLNGMVDGLRMAGTALRTGQGSDLFTKIDKPKPHLKAWSSSALDLSGMPGRAVDLLGEVIRGPSRLLTAEDELFKAVGYRMELHALAYRQASQEGLSGPAFWDRVATILENPPDNIRLGAIDASHYVTFTDKSGPIASAMTRAGESVPLLRLVVPFIRTPSNIYRFTMQRTPLAPLMKSFWDEMQAGGARRDLALARLSLGSMTMASALYMAAGGYLTGGGPQKKELRDNLVREGWQPYSIKVGDTYHSIQGLEPVGTMLGMAADLYEISGELKQGDLDEAATMLAAGAARVFVNKTYLRGLSDALETVTNPAQSGGKFLQSFAGSMVPMSGMAGTIRQETDPRQREVKAGRESWIRGLQTMINTMKDKTPTYSQDLPPRRNLWGESVAVRGAVGPDMLSPIYTSKEKRSPIDLEMIANRVAVSMPERTLHGVRLTAKEYDRLVQLAGNKLKLIDDMGCRDYLNQMVRDDLYREQTQGEDGGRSRMIHDVIKTYRRAAQAQLIEEFPELEELIMKKQQERIDKLTPAQ